MGKQFNLTDTTSKLVHDNELGLGVDFVDTERRLKCSTIRHTLISKKITESSVSEEQRLLYVAMTRAKEKLIITCVTGTKDSPRSPSRFLNPIIKNDQR